MHLKQQSGFTLAEIAIVVFLIGMMASVGLAALNAQMVRASISATQQKQETIKDALIAFLGTNKRLPCPAVDQNGQGSRTATAPANCTGYFGIVPYASLGLPKSAALDGWDNFFSYAVSSQWTLTYSSAAPVLNGTSTNVPGSAFNVGISGTFIVKDRSPTSPYAIIAPSTSTIAAVIVISHGKDGLGAFTSKFTQNVSPVAGTDQLSNVPVKPAWAAPATFYKREYTDIDVPTFGAFDDVVMYLNPNDLIIPLKKDGALKSPEATWAEQITNINNAVIGFMFSNSNCVPPADQTTFETLLTNNGIPKVDPWGGSLTYAAGVFSCLKNDGRYKTTPSFCPNNCGTCFLPASNFPAFTITTSTVGISIQPQNLSTITAARPGMLSQCMPA